MKIEKTEHSYHVTECDLKFGEKVSLDGELLIPISVLDKIRAELHETAEMHEDDVYYLREEWIDEIIDKYREQEPETGRWIKYGVPRCGEQHYKCTSCGYYINFGQWGELYTKEFKYCPNCGVRMENIE